MTWHIYYTSLFPCYWIACYFFNYNFGIAMPCNYNGSSIVPPIPKRKSNIWMSWESYQGMQAPQAIYPVHHRLLGIAVQLLVAHLGCNCSGLHGQAPTGSQYSGGPRSSYYSLCFSHQKSNPKRVHRPWATSCCNVACQPQFLLSVST